MKGKVLVVDDESTIRRSITSVLKDNGYDSAETDGFHSAVEMLETNEYDVMLTDKNVPIQGYGKEVGMNLIQWASIYKPNFPIILMTEYTSVNPVVDFLNYGVSDYLWKPLDMKLLVLKIDLLCRLKKSINPKAILNAYSSLNRKLIEAICLNTDGIRWLPQIQERLSHIFEVFHSSEQIILEHRQNLAEIQISIENAMENLPEDNPLYKTLRQISEKASRRI